jgi:hypothetical protein
MGKTAFFLRFWSFLTVLLLGCGTITTIYSNIKIEQGDFEKLDSIVDSTFLELGYSGGIVKPANKERSYSKWIKNKSGRSAGYWFIVTYQILPEEVLIHIETKISGYGQEERPRTTNKYLSEITGLLDKRLREAHLSFTIETKSYWVPSVD